MGEPEPWACEWPAWICWKLFQVGKSTRKKNESKSRRQNTGICSSLCSSMINGSTRRILGPPSMLSPDWWIVDCLSPPSERSIMSGQRFRDLITAPCGPAFPRLNNSACWCEWVSDSEERRVHSGVFLRWRIIPFARPSDPRLHSLSGKPNPADDHSQLNLSAGSLSTLSTSFLNLFWLFPLSYFVRIVPFLNVVARVSTQSSFLYSYCWSWREDKKKKFKVAVMTSISEDVIINYCSMLSFAPSWDEDRATGLQQRVPLRGVELNTS